MEMNTTKMKGLNKQLMRLVALVLMCVIGTSSIVTVAALTKDITIVDGENRYVVSTMQAETDKILEMAGIVVGENDKVVRDDTTNTITVKRAFEVSVAADGKKESLIFTEGTVADALKEAGVTLNENDTVSPEPTATLTPGMQVKVTRWHTLTLTVGGKTQTAVVPEGSLQNALFLLNIGVDENDVISMDIDSDITEDGEVTIDRVTYREVTSTEPVEFEVESIETDELYEGESKVVREGTNGERTVVTSQRLVNGEVAEETVVSNEVTTQPVSKQVLVGTKTKPAAAATVASDGTLLDSNGNEISYSKVFTGNCTAYSAEEGSRTASGLLVSYGRVAVNPNVIPYGTRLYICSPDGSYVYGYAIAADTGGAMMSGQALADLFFNTDDECRSFGRRKMSIYVLA